MTAPGDMRQLVLIGALLAIVMIRCQHVRDRTRTTKRQPVLEDDMCFGCAGRLNVLGTVMPHTAWCRFA